MRKFDTKTVVFMGVLTALEIILNRFLSVNAWNIKIGFNFIPIAIAAILYGPLCGGIVAALGDLVGAVLFPIGAYFPGFTLTAFLTGAVLGLFLHKKQSAVNILCAVAINQLILGLLLNSFWISVLYVSPYVPLLATRVIQCAILLPVQFIGIWMIKRIIPLMGKKATA